MQRKLKTTPALRATPPAAGPDFGPINVPPDEDSPAEMPIASGEVKHYKVKIKGLFVAHNEVFRPGVTYRVSPEIYNGNIEDGKPFKDFCETVEEERQQ